MHGGYYGRRGILYILQERDKENVYEEDLVEYENDWNVGSGNHSSIGLSRESKIENENSDLE